jgi:hypothetical protein
MSSNVPGLRDGVFCKTEKGRAELGQRQAGLNSRQRSVLIMLDGRKRLSDLETLLPSEVLQGIVDVLVEQDFIAPVRLKIEPAAVGPAGASARGAPSAKLIEIKQMMVQSAEAHIGLLAADVVRRIEHAGDEAQLMSVLGHWNMAMHESKHGREVARLQLDQIKASLQGEERGAEESG